MQDDEELGREGQKQAADLQFPIRFCRPGLLQTFSGLGKLSPNQVLLAADQVQLAIQAPDSALGPEALRLIKLVGGLNLSVDTQLAIDTIQRITGQAALAIAIAGEHFSLVRHAGITQRQADPKIK